MPLSTRRATEIVFTLSFTSVLMIMGFSIISPVLPLFASSFGVTATMAGFAITSFGLARMVGDIPAGQISQRHGRRLLLVLAPIAAAVSALCSGLSTNLWQLVAFRFGEGLASGFYTTTALTALMDISTQENRGRLMALYQGLNLFGVGLGPTLGGYLAEWYGYRSPFYFYAAIALVAAIWALLRIPETRDVGDESGKKATSVDGATDEGSAKVDPRQILHILIRSRAFLLVTLISFFVHFTRMGARTSLMPLFGDYVLRLSESQIGLAFSLVALANGLTLFPSGYVSDRFGRKAAIVPGMIIGALGIWIISLSTDYTLFLYGSILLGLGMGIASPAPGAYLADITPKQVYGPATGIFRCISDAGFVIAPIALGWIADNYSYPLSFQVNAILIVISALMFGLWAKNTHQKKNPTLPPKTILPVSFPTPPK